MTRRSSKTKPVPSRTLLQLCAVPTTLTMERFAFCATGLAARPESGGWTSVIGSLEKGLKTCGKPFCARTERKSANQEAGLLRQGPVDALEHLGAAYLLTDGRQGRAGQQPADQPGDQEHGDDVDHGAAGGVQRAGRGPGDVAAELVAEVGGEGLADRGADDDDDHRDDGGGRTDLRVVGDGVPEDGQQQHGGQSAAEEPDHRQDADDEPLAVSDHREPHGGDQQQDVQHVHRICPLLSRAWAPGRCLEAAVRSAPDHAAASRGFGHTTAPGTRPPPPRRRTTHPCPRDRPESAGGRAPVTLSCVPVERDLLCTVPGLLPARVVQDAVDHAGR